MLSLDLKDLFVPSHYLDAAPQGACPCTDINQYARRKKGLQNFHESVELKFNKRAESHNESQFLC